MDIRHISKMNFVARGQLLIGSALTVAVFAVFWQMLGHDFVNFDDEAYVTSNAHVQAGLTLEGIAWAFTTFHAANWHPLTWLSHMLDCQLFGLNPTGHHLTSLLLHLANTLLVALVLYRMTGALWRSSLVAALFAIHPLHVESVAWVAERKDVLSTFFWFLTLWAYLSYAKRPTHGRYLLVLFYFTCGLMAKPMLVTLPFVLLLLDYWPLARARQGQQEDKGSSKPHTLKGFWPPPTPLSGLFWEKVPFFALSIVSSVVTLVAQGSGGAISSLDAIPAKSRIANAVVSYVQYIGKMIWPHTLAVLYPHPGHTLATWEVAGTSALLVCISGLAIFVRRRYPYVLMGWLWYIGTLIPVIGLVQVGLQATADRYTYVPLLGIFIIFAWGLGDIESSWRYGRTAFRTGTLALLLALSLSARSQLHSWQNSFRLFEHTLQVTSRNYVAHTVLASALASAGKLDEAIIQLKEALNIEPRYAGAHKSLGTVLAAKGRVHEALVHYAEALLNKPGDVETHYNLATVLDANGRVDEAIVHYVEALRIAPSYTEAHYNLARVLASRGKLNEAVGHYHEVLRSNPYHAGAHVHLAVALERQSKIPEAIEHYQRALLLKPDWPEAMNNLAWIFATEADPKIRNAAKALELAQKACRLKDNKDVQLMDTLAAAYAEATQFQEAIETAQRAQELALAKGQQDLADVIEQRIRQYKAHKPYHEKAMTDAHPSTEPHGADTAPPEFHGSANQERPHLALSCV